MKSLSMIMFLAFNHPNPVTRAVYRDIFCKRLEGNKS